MLRVDCNETGFTKENVVAICSIGQSTKGRVDRVRGYIGEKGIGFKSVFNVANVVYISSGPFQFKFDRRKILGMITPMPKRFPRTQKLPNQTQMLLHLKDSEVSHISDELENIQPQLLIFLRKLSTIIIGSGPSPSQFQISRKTFDTQFKGETAELIKYFLVGSTAPGNPNSIVKSKYIIVRHRVHDLPEDYRRPGVQESEIVLAFPVAENSNPVIMNQYVYAFLPIDEYGFSVRI